MILFYKFLNDLSIVLKLKAWFVLYIYFTTFIVFITGEKGRPGFDGYTGIKGKLFLKVIQINKNNVY